MEKPRLTRYSLHGRAQVASPNQSVVSGQTLDVSVAGVCILLDDQVPVGAACTIRFEIFVKESVHVITALTKSIYGVFATHGGFRAGFEFKEADPQRTALINSLAGKKPMADPTGKASATNAVHESFA